LLAASRSCDKDVENSSLVSSHDSRKSKKMVRMFWALLIAVLYALHQDLWFWRTARPLLFGFLPVALTYHAAYCLAAAALMWGLSRAAWPADLEKVPPR
jgi:hypothetical protein